MSIFKINHINVEFGENVTVSADSNLYDCFLGDDVFVGPFVEIQKNVKIGQNTRIHSHTFICEHVRIGKNCFIGHGVIFTNDLLIGGPARGDQLKYKKTVIHDDVSIGSNATILPVEIVSGVIIGAGSVVTKDIVEKGIYAGNPARKISNVK